MAGLMMVFLFLAVILMRHASGKLNEEERIESQIHNDLLDLRSVINKDLEEIRKKETKFPELDIVVLEDGMRFEKMNFALGEDGWVKGRIPSALKKALDLSFPQFVDRIIMAPKYRDRIHEFRVEGHASKGSGTYENNLLISQLRALSVVKYCLSEEMIDRIDGYEDVDDRIRSITRAIGYSYSRPLGVTKKKPKGDADASQRVEFSLLLRPLDMPFDEGVWDWHCANANCQNRDCGGRREWALLANQESEVSCNVHRFQILTFQWKQPNSLNG